MRTGRPTCDCSSAPLNVFCEWSVMDTNEKKRGSARPVMLGTGLVVAAVAIAGGVWLSNGSTAGAATCEARPEVAQFIDDAARGELAALLPSSQWRNYSDLAFQDAN